MLPGAVLLLALAIRSQNERALARAYQDSYLAHLFLLIQCADASRACSSLNFVLDNYSNLSHPPVCDPESPDHRGPGRREADDEVHRIGIVAVSYTHLTLPTNREV